MFEFLPEGHLRHVIKMAIFQVSFFSIKIDIKSFMQDTFNFLIKSVGDSFFQIRELPEGEIFHFLFLYDYNVEIGLIKFKQ